MEKRDVSEILKEFFGVQGDIARDEEKVRASKTLLEKLNEELIDRMEGMGLNRLTDSHGRTVYLKSPAVHASINKENKLQALEFLKKDWDLGDFVSETIPPTTLSRVVKEKIEQGEPIPSEYFSYYLKKKIGYMSSRK